MTLGHPWAKIACNNDRATKTRNYDVQRENTVFVRSLVGPVKLG